METNQGWIAIHRQLQESEIWFKPDIWLKIWLYILFAVSYSDGRFPRGTYFFRYDWIANNTGATYNQVKHCMDWLRTSKNIATQKATQGIIITVLNYAKYQDVIKDKSQTKSHDHATTTPDRSHNITNKATKQQRTNKYILQPTVAEEYSFQNQLSKMFKDKDRRMSIIAYYWTIKGFNFNNGNKYSSALKRELRPAGDLIGYTNEEIKKTCQWLKENSDFKWTLETVLKYIDEPLEELKAGGKKITEDDFIKSLKQQNYGKT